MRRQGSIQPIKYRSNLFCIGFLKLESLLLCDRCYFHGRRGIFNVLTVYITTEVKIASQPQYLSEHVQV